MEYCESRNLFDFKNKSILPSINFFLYKKVYFM